MASKNRSSSKTTTTTTKIDTIKIGSDRRPPVVEPLPPELSPEAAFERLSAFPYCLWLDSALQNDPRSRFSYIAVDPCRVHRIDRPVADPLADIDRWLARHATENLPDLPPFQGGIAGYMSYEFGRCFERIRPAKHDEFGLPLAILGLYDVVLAWDHTTGQGWLISQGYGAGTHSESSDRSVVAQRRAAQMRERLFSSQSAAGPEQAASVHAMAHGLTAPQFETRLGGGWLGNFDSEGYRATVDRAREYILAGDIFQVNLSQRLLCPARCDARELYRRLRRLNAAPFAAYFDLGPAQIVSASPERFLKVHQGWIETRPIKGTRRRPTNIPRGMSHSDEEMRIAAELASCSKDRAENIMIVDLLRNDLSRICDPGSLIVDQLCGIEYYPFVIHLVSSIRAKMRSDAGFSDLIAAVFPGGSITGAPKVRAMEIISELEPTVRGPYCGSLGYVGTNGEMDWNILIRTLTCSRGWWQFQVGGGIVADSQPDMEEEETWTKAAGIIAAIDATL
ncbi:MAG: aminodeoxychorismate synthase component I [Planctomycetota bacterium]|jgi:para-aminobenzoate synthetase component 1